MKNRFFSVEVFARTKRTNLFLLYAFFLHHTTKFYISMHLQIEHDTEFICYATSLQHHLELPKTFNLNSLKLKKCISNDRKSSEKITCGCLMYSVRAVPLGVQFVSLCDSAFPSGSLQNRKRSILMNQKMFAMLLIGTLACAVVPPTVIAAADVQPIFPEQSVIPDVEKIR